jgi:hypothetical protein
MTAREILNEKWPFEGECKSCGWHGELYEYNVSDEALSNALKNGGILRLPCLNTECNHSRGVSIRINCRLE